jgi:hypothetical protein
MPIEPALLKVKKPTPRRYKAQRDNSRSIRTMHASCVTELETFAASHKDWLFRGQRCPESSFITEQIKRS